MSIDCLLIYPYLEEANWKNELRSKDILALGYLASSLRSNGYSVKILHAEHLKLNPDQVVKYVIESNPKIVGISCTAQRAYEVTKTYSELIKEKLHVPIIVGGIFPTIAHKEILEDCQNIDAVCRGEGEQIIVDFVRAVIRKGKRNEIKGITYREDNGLIVVNERDEDIANLDELPIPAKDYLEDMMNELDAGLYYINISAGRGCYGKCSFCSTNKLYARSKRRLRSPLNVVNEIDYFFGRYNTTYFKFVDEIFIDPLNHDWIYKFCNEIKTRNIKIKFHIEARVDAINEDIISKLIEVGLDEIFVGLEAGNNNALLHYKKGHSIEMAEKAIVILKKYDLKLQFGYIMIDPYLSFENLEYNVLWLLKAGGYSKHNLYNKINLYYGTDLYQTLKTQNLLENKPFYKRETTKFMDDKVELFTKMIDKAKLLFSDYDHKVNAYLKALMMSSTKNVGWKDIAELLNKIEVNSWTDIVITAIREVKENSINLDSWEAFVTKQVDDCNRNLLNLIA